MKGYIVNGKAYIFPQTAAEIPEVEADVFYVQEENFTEWVAENESIADKLVKYNYNVMTVKPKEWAGHTDDDLEPAQKEDPELAWSEDSATVTIGADDNVFPTLTNPNSVTVSYSSSDSEKATIDDTTGEITLVAAGETIISAIFEGDETYEAQTVTYTLTVQAAPAPQPEDPELAWSEDSATVTIGADDNVFPTLTNPHSVTVSYSSSDSEKATIDATTGEITLVAAGDTTISAVFAGDATYEAQTVTYTLTVQAAQPEPETYDVIVDAWDEEEIIDSASAGESVTTWYNSAYGNIVGVTPSDLQYTLSGEDLSFTMPDETVTFKSELPVDGTPFGFTGYEDNVTETPSSTGTVDYNGIDSDYPTYIIGMAHVTFTGSEQEVEQVVYILRSDAPNMKNGTRIPVYTLNNDQFVPFGYGELTQQ